MERENAEKGDKIELEEHETMEGWLTDCDDVDDTRAMYLSENLEVPFRATHKGKSCKVVRAITGPYLLVQQAGETFVVEASDLSDAKGYNGAILAEWNGS